jgi:hypothetical protein
MMRKRAAVRLISAKSRFLPAFRIPEQPMSHLPTTQPGLSPADRKFLRAVTRALVTPAVYDDAHIDVVANLERLIGRANEGNRANVLRLVRWCRRIAFVYGGPLLPARAARSRFVALQRLARALSSLCLLAFWGDEAAHALIDSPDWSA